MKVKMKKRAFVESDNCVACGCCIKVCPRSAITIFKGFVARVNFDTCIGCGKCAKECPASTIKILEVQP